jgi:DNA-binding NtrC family response regulator
MFSDSTILMVGGNAKDRDDIHGVLGDRFHVVAADSVDDALSHSDSKDSIEVVICDLDVERANGLEFVRAWRARDPETPIIGLTDGRDVSAIVEAMKQGANDCLMKPVNSDNLRQTVERAMDDRPGAGRSGPRSASDNSRPHIDIPPGTSLEDLERAAVEQALVEHQGNRTHAAKTLGISVRTLQRKLKAWGLPDLAFHGAVAENSFHSFMLQPSGASHTFGVHAH